MLREELKKIWRPGIVLALVVLGFVYYTMFLEFYINVFPNNYGGENGKALLTVSGEWIGKYGTAVSESEMEEIKAARPVLEQEAGRYIREYEIGEKHGLKTYADYITFYQAAVQGAAGKNAADEDENYADAMRMENYLQSEEADYIAGRLYAINMYTDFYRIKQECEADIDNSSWFQGYTQRETEHARTFFGKDKQWQNILPWEIPETIGSFAGYLFVWICLSICLLLSPLLVHDRQNRMLALQYSSKRGRGIWKSQFAAVITSAFFVTSMNLVLFGGLFAKHGTSVFFPCRMYSFLSEYSWPNWTHGVWCLVLAGMCYVTAFGAAGVVFFLSQSSANYIVLLLKLLPFFAVLAAFCPKMFAYAFYYENTLYQLSRVPYIEGLCAFGILAAGTLVSVLAWRRIKREFI